MNYLVSIVMATFNDNPDWLHRSIKSIINQDYLEWELIIIDDSTEINTLNVLYEYKLLLGNKLKLIHNNKRLGFVKSLNIGFKLADGEFIARLDGDDECLSERLSLQVTFLKCNSDVDILGGAIQYRDIKGVIRGVRNYPINMKSIIRFAYFRDPIAHPSVIFRKDILDKIGYYNCSFKRAEDYEYWLRALKRGCKIANLSEVIITYQLTDNYSMKRDKEHWKYCLMAKVKNFNFNSMLFVIMGIIFSVFIYALPNVVIDYIYKIDTNRPILSRGKIR